MFFDDPVLLAVAVAFGAWLGWAMASRPAVRNPAIVSLLVALGAGLATSVIAGVDPATSGGQAAVSLTVGPAAALLTYSARSRGGGGQGGRTEG